MKKFRIFCFFTIFIGFTAIFCVLYSNSTTTPYKATLSPLFQELGKPIKSIDRIFSRALPLDEIDEKTIGEAIKSRFAKNSAKKNQGNQKIQTYLNKLIDQLTGSSKKPFSYNVYLHPGPPNAFALPGGVIVITDELLNALNSEGELVAILGHEIGHIERGHCFDMFREEMLRKKYKSPTIATSVSEIFHSVLEISFSKSQEDESDLYAFQLLTEHNYCPYSLASSFQKLIELSESEASPNLLDDFFNSHPYLEIRKEKFHSEAVKWSHRNRNIKTYVGRRNLEQFITRQEATFPEELSAFIHKTIE